MLPYFAYTDVNTKTTYISSIAKALHYKRLKLTRIMTENAIRLHYQQFIKNIVPYTWSHNYVNVFQDGDFSQRTSLFAL